MLETLCRDRSLGFERGFNPSEILGGFQGGRTVWWGNIAPCTGLDLHVMLFPGVLSLRGNAQSLLHPKGVNLVPETCFKASL